MKKLLLLLLLLFIVGCTESVVVEETSWVEYINDEGLSIERPDWEGDFDFNETLFALNYGGCMVAANRYDGTADLMYDWLLTVFDDQGVDIFYSNKGEGRIEYGTDYLSFVMHSRVDVYECNNYAYNLIFSCEESRFGNLSEEVDRFYGSVSCNEAMKEEVSYTTFYDDELQMEVPDWTPIETQGNVLALNDGYCSFYVAESDSSMGEVYDWVYFSLDNVVKEGDSLEYTTPYDEIDMDARTLFLDCNYKTYMVTHTCVEGLKDSYVMQNVENSVICNTVEIVEEVEEEVVEEVTEEVIEEVEEVQELVNLELPSDLDFVEPEWIVYFINSNDFFTMVLEDYSKVNLVLEGSENFNMKADLVAGEIVYVEEGLYEDGVTVYIPKDDAVEILNNVDNINFVNFLVFAAKVHTDPVELKQEVINKVLGL